MNQRSTPVPPAPAPETPQARRVVDETPGKPGQTTPHVHGQLAPRLPHERDESADSQTSNPQPVIEQARQDVERGLVDTDRGPVLDQLYHDRVRDPGTGETAGASSGATPSAPVHKQGRRGKFGKRRRSR